MYGALFTDMAYFLFSIMIVIISDIIFDNRLIDLDLYYYYILTIAFSDLYLEVSV